MKDKVREIKGAPRMVWLFVGINAGILLLVAWFVLKFFLPRKGGGYAPHPVAVEAAEVKAETIYAYMDAIGVCRSIESVKVFPQIQGTAELMSIAFKQGEHVKEGQLLFSLDDRSFRADRDRAEAQLKADEARLVIHVAQLERSLELAAKKFVSQQEFDTYKANVEEATAAVAADKANLEKAQLQLDFCSVRAPVSGIMGRYEVDRGNIVSASTLLSTIENSEQLYIDFNLSENDFKRFRKYQQNGEDLKIQVRFNGYKDIAQLVYFANTVDSQTGTFALRGTFDNKDGLFWPGQTVSTRLLLKKIEGGLLIPEQAVQVNKNGTFVFLVQDDSTVKIQPVSLGQQYKQNVHIKKGLQPGQKVVTRGQILLAPGSKVIILSNKSDGKKPFIE